MTDGFSNPVHGERAGFNNTAWDARFLDLIENNPVRLAGMVQPELATRSGMENAEVIMWVLVRGALSPIVRTMHQSSDLLSMTGIATVSNEQLANPPVAGKGERRQRRMDEHHAGLYALQGTHPFTLKTSVRACRLNKRLNDMARRAHRGHFLVDEDAAFEAAGLTTEERDLVRTRDWRGLIHYGVIFFMLAHLSGHARPCAGGRLRNFSRRAMHPARFIC